VLEEKMQRIAEVLLGSVSPFQLMIGKLIGTVGVSFTVLAVYLAGAALAAYRTGMADKIPLDLAPWFLIYQASAILMFGAVFAAIGSACNDIKEAQSLQMPVWIVVCLPMFVWIAVLREPSSTFSTAISLFPPCTPILMLLRQSTPVGVPAWQPWAGLAGVLICTVLCVWIAGRVFRVGILLQGKPPKFSAMARWALSG
jgi:ABC-2 type transport system permease protein